MIIKYPATFTPQEPSGYCVQFIDLENAFTQGETVEECEFNGSEVLSMILEDRLERGEAIPQPTPGVAGAHYLAPAISVQSALLLRQARGDRSLFKRMYNKR